MEAIEELRRNFLAAGGSASEFETLGRGNLKVEDSVLQDGSSKPEEARAMAMRIARGGLIEYHCYDNRGRPQGVAVVRVDGWPDDGSFRFVGTHLKASDEYYEWWASQNLSGSHPGYHLCMAPRARCREGNPDGSEVVHITRWRQVSPQLLVGPGYASDAVLSHFQAQLNSALLKEPPRPPAVRPATRTGLDDQARARASVAVAAEEDDDLAELAELARRGAERRTRRTSPEAPRRPGFGEVLANRAKVEEENRALKRRKAEGAKTKRPHDEVEALRRKKAKGLGDDSESEGEDSSDREQVFRKASSREVDLESLSRKDPGCLLRSALREMEKYIAARGEATVEDPTHGRFLSYLHQVLLPQHPKAGLRSQRELVTIATSLDFLVAGSLGRCGDLLTQRFKALEASLSAEGNWSVARHHEIIPTQATLSTQAEMTQAAKAELRAQKLKLQLTKNLK